MSLDNPVNCAALSADGKKLALGHGLAPGVSLITHTGTKEVKIWKRSDAKPAAKT